MKQLLFHGCPKSSMLDLSCTKLYFVWYLWNLWYIWDKFERKISFCIILSSYSLSSSFNIKRVLLKRRRSHGRVTYVLCIHKHIKLTWWRKRKINIRKSTLYAYMSFMISIITCWVLWKRLLFITAQDWIQWQGIYFSLEICEIMLCIKAFKEEFKSRFMTGWLFQIINHIIS